MQEILFEGTFLGEGMRVREGGNLQPAFKNINMHIVKHSNSTKKSFENCFICNRKSKIIYQISNFLQFQSV